MCEHPILIKKVLPGRVFSFDRVACGQCMSCRVALTREWTIRLLDELSVNPKASFLTLTYKGINFCGLSKRCIQLFMKRFRKSFSGKLKYYFCGEYGPETFRPHYHAIIFGWRPHNSELCYVSTLANGRKLWSSPFIEKLWPYGFNTVDEVNHDSIQYVVGYVRKKLTGDVGSEVYGPFLPPFSLSSQGLGLSRAISNYSFLKDNLYIPVNGKKAPIPRYYKEKLDLSGVVNLSIANREKYRSSLEPHVGVYLDKLIESEKVVGNNSSAFSSMFDDGGYI